MQKGMMAMAIVAVLSFFVSIGAVSTSFSKQGEQTVPKSQQQQIPTLQMKEHLVQVRKDKVWNMVVDRIEVKGKVIKKGG